MAKSTSTTAETRPSDDKTTDTAGPTMAEVTAEHDRLKSDVATLESTIVDLSLRGPEDLGTCAMAALALRAMDERIKATETERDTAQKLVTDLSAQLDRPAPVVTEQRAIERPSHGRELNVPKKAAKHADAVAALADDPLVMVLCDADGVVQPTPAFVGRADMFVLGEDARIAFAPEIVLPPESARMVVRTAWLLSATGAVLGVCRLSADLPAGGGAAASIPAKALVFDFDD